MTPGDDGLPLPQRRIAMLSILAFSVMGIFSTSLVTIALPTIAREMAATESASVWIVSSYQLAVAASMLAFSGVGALVGLRPVFIGGLAVFTAASFACMLATSLSMLIGLRFLQGLGAAAATCVTPALFSRIYPQRMLGQALGLTALVVAVAMAVGPALGGVVVAHAHWPWLFAVQAPIGLAILPLLYRTLPREPRRQHRFDWGGATSSVVGVGLLVLAMNQLGRPAGLTDGAVLLLCAVVALGVFLRTQQAATAPLLPLELLHHARFRAATVASVLANVGQGMALISLPFLLQVSYGLGVLKSGLLLTAMPAAIMVAAPVSGRLSDRIGSASLASAGLLFVAAGLALLAALDPRSATDLDIVLRVFLCGLGFGMFQTPNNREFLSGVDGRYLGQASGMLSFSRNMGLTVGATLVSIALALQVAGPVGEAGASGVHRLCLWAAAGATLAATFVSSWRLRWSGRAAS
jgi:DHA2 family multidrug resistance protein-like MFS transporter